MSFNDGLLGVRHLFVGVVSYQKRFHTLVSLNFVVLDGSSVEFVEKLHRAMTGTDYDIVDIRLDFLKDFCYSFPSDILIVVEFRQRPHLLDRQVDNISFHYPVSLSP